MTRVFLAAGVAALAISAPANAGPHGGGRGGGGNDRQQNAFVNHGGGGGGQRQQAEQRRGGGGGGQGFAQARQQRQQHFAAVERPQRAERQQARPQRMERQQARSQRMERTQQTRVAQRQQARPQRMERTQQVRVADRQQFRNDRRQQVQTRFADRQQMHANRMQQAQNGLNGRQQLRFDRQARQQDLMAQRQQMRGDRQMATRNLLADRHALRADRIANANAFRESRLASALSVTPRTRFIAPADAVRFVDQPVSRVNSYVPLMALPQSVSYLYPDTPNYYYQYGGGYLYQVDRGSSLINALIPLLAGGYLPGTYLPQNYMNSYVPSYYGLNSFYPSNYAYGYGDYGYGANYNYGYGTQNLCNRYANGVVYQVDCYTGMVYNVIPTYAGGYGVGQMLPSAYSYYNLPMQYRSMYQPAADYSYWYAPGAIYQYDTSSSLITSVAALMAPGFSVGQPLPAGYGMYNVPYAYRDTYYDTPNAWYRYNNGYIYQVNPATQLVTAVVASLLT